MAGKKPTPKPGRPRRADSEERSRPVLFRMRDLYPQFDRRTAIGVSASRVAQRDLRRYWTLAEHQLRNIEVVTEDVHRLAEVWIGQQPMQEMSVAGVMPALIRGYAESIGTPSLVDLSVADACALADLFACSTSADQAVELLARTQNSA